MFKLKRLALILELELERFFEILNGEFSRIPLTGHLDLEAAGAEPVALVGDRCGELHGETIEAACDGRPVWSHSRRDLNASGDVPVPAGGSGLIKRVRQSGSTPPGVRIGATEPLLGVNRWNDRHAC